MTPLEEKVYRKIVKKMDVDESTLEGFDENSPLFGEANPGEVSMNLDSIDILELVILIEKEWGISEIADEDVTKLVTVKGIADYVAEHAEKPL